MPIRANRAYNDPALGQAFSNLSALFGPPDPSETAAYAAARARNAEAAATEAEARRNSERYEWLANPANQADPAYKQRAEGYFLGTGGRPDQSFYSVDQSNETLRRGQDVESGDRRYNVDVGARTTLATNAATVAGSLQNQRTQSLAGLFGPLDPGQVRPELPAEIATQFGAPGTIGAASGASKPLSESELIAKIIERQPEERQNTFVADKYAPTLTQVEGQDRRRLVESGQISDQQIVDLVTGERSPVEAIDPATGRPTFMSPGQAVRTGAQPYAKPTADSSTEISRLIAERDTLPVGNPNRTAYDQRIQALGRGQQQSAYDRTNDENLATLNDTISKAGAGAVGDRATLARLQEAVANPDTPQGAMAGTNLAMRKVLTAFGIPAGDTSEAEMVQALGNQLALRLRDPSNGGGMPGSLSDSDRQFLASMAVGLGNSPAANQKLVAYYLRIQGKNIDLDNLRRDYIRKNARLDEGFRDLAADYLQKTGIYADVTGAALAPAASPAAPPSPAPAAAPAVAGRTFDTPGGQVRFRRLD